MSGVGKCYRRTLCLVERVGGGIYFIAWNVYISVIRLCLRIYSKKTP